MLSMADERTETGGYQIIEKFKMASKMAYKMAARIKILIFQVANNITIKFERIFKHFQ